MVGIGSDFAGRSALAQLRGNASARTERPGATVPGVVGGIAAGTAPSFFNVQSSLRSEGTVFRALGESLGTARGATAAATAGTRQLSSILDNVDSVIAAVDAGATGSAFKSTLEGLEQRAAVAIARSGYGGTNLLEEGESLTVTLGFKAGSTTDFRQLGFAAVGLSPTEAARRTTTVQKTVTETVETPVTRGEALQQRAEKLSARIEAVTNREARIESSIEKLTARQDKLTNRLDRLATFETRIENRIEAVGGRPDNTADAVRLDQAKRFKAFADQLEERGSTVLARFVNGVAEATARRAGLTVSLDDLEKLENRLTKVGERQIEVAERISSTTNRLEIIGERLIEVQDRKATLTEKLESTTERLDHLSVDQLNKVVRTVTETVERQIEVAVPNEKASGFDDLISLVQKKLSAGDTEGARAIVTEARDRIARVEGQLGQIDGALGRRSSFFGEVTDRIDSSIRIRIDQQLSGDDAARRAAEILSELAKSGRLFGGEKAGSGILALFSGKPSEEPTPVESDAASTRFASAAAARALPAASGDIEPFRSGPRLGNEFSGRL